MYDTWDLSEDPPDAFSSSAPPALTGAQTGAWPRSVAAVVLNGVHPFELGVACEVFGLERPELEPAFRKELKRILGEKQSVG